MIQFRYDESGSPYLDHGSAKLVLLDMIDEIRRTGHTLPVKAGGRHPFTQLAVLGMSYRALNDGKDEDMPDPHGINDIIATLRKLRENIPHPPHVAEHLDLAVAMLRRYRAIASPEGVYGPDEFVAEIEHTRSLLEEVPDTEGERLSNLAEAEVRSTLALAMATAAIARRPPL